MSRDPSVDVFDMATCLQHVPHGDSVLEHYGPNSLKLLAGMVTVDSQTFYRTGESMGVSHMALDEVWYWFHPDLYETNLYHRKRQEAPGEPPKL
jgi:hypothetical protein